MSVTSPSQDMQTALTRAIAQIEKVLKGKPQQIRLAFTALLADGHVLIEDIPGVGKTTLAQAFSQVLGLKYQRLQFTSDMLPADILGVSIYERSAEKFTFHPGPIFTQVLLADEINRATPRSQSALLEAMAERQVSIDGTTYPLEQPFFVLATQNPSDLAGTYALPDSQLDRFMIRMRLGYPDRSAERQILRNFDRNQILAELKPVLNGEHIQAMQRSVTNVKVSDALLDYIQALIDATRNHACCAQGLSPRGGLALVRCAQAWAFVNAREYAIPEDVQQVFPAVTEHRLLLQHDSPLTALQLVNDILENTAVN